MKWKLEGHDRHVFYSQQNEKMHKSNHTVIIIKNLYFENRPTTVVYKPVLHSGNKVKTIGTINNILGLH